MDFPSEERSLFAFFSARKKCILVGLVSLLLAAASIVFLCDERNNLEGGSSFRLGGALANTTEMLRELFERSPGARQGSLLATKRPHDGWLHPLGSRRSAPESSPLRQRALGKIFDDEPVVPNVGEEFAREPFTLEPVTGDPLIDFSPQTLLPLGAGLEPEYGGNPPFYFLPPGSGGDIITPPVTAPVPEPAAWSMLLVGLGVCGSVLRRRRSMSRSMGRSA